jgi:hypothetical protein
MSVNMLENAENYKDEIVAIVPHTFMFVYTDRFAPIKFEDDPDFTQTNILVCADRFPYTRLVLSAQILSVQTNLSKI